jgi:hypothetical protein
VTLRTKSARLEENRMRKIRDVLSDDALWYNRARSYSDWARLLGFHAKAIQSCALQRGWKRDVRGRVTHAPCSGCAQQAAVDLLDASRRCEGCRAPQLDAFDPVAVYRAERDRRLDVRRDDMAALKAWREQVRP